MISIGSLIIYFKITYVCLCVQNENIGSLAFEQKYGKLLRMDKIITLKIQDKYLRKLDNS